MEHPETPDIEIEEDDGYDTDDIEELLDWIDEDVEMQDEEEEECEDGDSTDFSDDECISFCNECGDRAVITMNNSAFCEDCYDSLYQAED